MVAPNSTSSYNANSSHMNFSWPPVLTGLERVLLSAQGNLQQMLSAYFARPIHVQLLEAQTFASLAQGLPNTPISPSDYPSIIKSASHDNPITQVRLINLVCAEKVVCTASSTVHIRSARCANLVLAEKYAIGQTFSKLGQPPLFELLAVGFGDPALTEGNGSAPGVLESGTGNSDPKRGALWRRYRISVPEYECEILEAFASREMFTRNGVDWLTRDDIADDGSSGSPREALILEGQPTSTSALAMAPVVMVAWVVLLLAFIIATVSITRVYTGC